MTTTTTTYDQVDLPTCTVTRETSDVTGRSNYTLTVEILGLDPVRTVTSEERLSGISSIAPPTVRSNDLNKLIELATVACCNSYDATDGYEIDGEILASISHRVAQSALQALRLMDEDV
jgi:hypothetical protein